VISSNDDTTDEPATSAATATPTSTRTPAPTATATATATASPRVLEEIEDLGVTVAAIDPGLVSQYDLDQTQGVVVVDVTPGSAAAIFEIEEGDVIESFANTEIATVANLEAAAAKTTSGTIVVQVARGGATQPLMLTLTPGLGLIPEFVTLADADKEVIRDMLRRSVPVDRVRRVLSSLAGTNVVTGSVVSITASQLVVDTGSPQGNLTYVIDANTVFGIGGSTDVAAADISVGDRVFVTSVDGETALLVIRVPTATP
jgi:membrane-associated protease RseP (regulator of RpoE activity)